MDLSETLIFIDANIYRQLYYSPAQHDTLATLVELKDRVLVPVQVVDEVARGKLDMASQGLNKRVKAFTTPTEKLPVIPKVPPEVKESADLLQASIDRLREHLGTAKRDVVRNGLELIQAVSRSEDDVTKALAPVFSGAAQPTDDEVRRARFRRERGNPPGKPADPLGDQLAWEQLLTHSKGLAGIWIVTVDGDYCTVTEGQVLLNPYLYAELQRAAGRHVEVFCFNALPKALAHFVEKTQAKTTHLPSQQELEEADRELREQLDRVQRLLREQDAENTRRLVSARTEITEPLLPPGQVSMGWLDTGSQRLQVSFYVIDNRDGTVEVTRQGYVLWPGPTMHYTIGADRPVTVPMGRMPREVFDDWLLSLNRLPGGVWYRSEPVE